jgi:hypothetical protein
MLIPCKYYKVVLQSVVIFSCYKLDAMFLLMLLWFICTKYFSIKFSDPRVYERFSSPISSHGNTANYNRYCVVLFAVNIVF